MPTTTSGFFLQCAPRGTLELVVPASGAPFGVEHHRREEEGAAWRCVATFGAGLGPIGAASLIQSNFGDPGHLEVVARAGDRLAAFWCAPSPEPSWSEPRWFAEGAAGAPALIQADFGGRGNFELVVPHAGGGIAHYYRDNDTAELAWRGPAVFGAGLGRVDAVAMIQRRPRGDLEVVARLGERLVRFVRPFGQEAWHGPEEIASGIGGAPALLQSNGKSGDGDPGHLELVAPLATVGLGHWRREGGARGGPFRGPRVFATDLGRCEAVALIESRPHGRIELAVQAEGQVVHLVRDGEAWLRRALIRRAPAGAKTAVPEAAAPSPATAATHSPATAATPSLATAATPSPATAATPSPVTAATTHSPATAATPSPATAATPSPATAATPSPATATTHSPATAATHSASASPPSTAAPPPERRRSSAAPRVHSGPHHAGFRRISTLALSADARYPDAWPFQGAIYGCPAQGAALLYYPASADGEEAPLSPGGPFPVIAIGHERRTRAAAASPGAPADNVQDYRQLAGLMAHLARWGFVVIAPDLSWLTPDSALERRAAVLRDALSHLRAGSRGPLLADFDRIGLLGHGLGACAALALSLDAASPFQIRALALLAPTGEPEQIPDIGALSPRPTLVLRGTADPIAAALPETLYGRARAPKHLVSIPGANHFGYTTSLALSPPVDAQAALPRREQQAIAMSYVAAFFNGYLRRARSHVDALCSRAGIEGLAGARDIEVRAERAGCAEP